MTRHMFTVGHAVLYMEVESRQNWCLRLAHSAETEVWRT